MLLLIGSLRGLFEINLIVVTLVVCWWAVFLVLALVVAVTVLRMIMLVLGLFQGSLQIGPRRDGGRQRHAEDEEAGQVDGVIAR